MKTEKRLWFPEIWQVVILRNDSYANSVFAGFACGWFNLPSLLFVLLVKPMWVMVKGLFAALVLMPIVGLLGNISTVNRTVDEAKKARAEQRAS